MSGTPQRYVATELSKLGGKGMTGHLESNPGYPFVTALKKNSIALDPSFSKRLSALDKSPI